jgi:cytochrome bd ubiquinol oxidase subunit II
MGIHDFWFIALAALFVGFLVLEGFDFGVGMLMGLFGRAVPYEQRDSHRRAVLNTIGPVWDGNEVWLITAGGAMFAAFPDMYATLFSGLYLPLLAILVAMIVRICAIEWRGKIDDPRWRRWADTAIAIGSWTPAVLWGLILAALVRGLPVDVDKQIDLSLTDVLNGYTLLGGLATTGLFAFHGAVFISLKTTGTVAEEATRFAERLSLPVTLVVAGFGFWTQFAYGKDWTWLVLGIAVTAQLTAMLVVWSRAGDGWAFTCTATVVAAVTVLMFGSLYPNLIPSSLNSTWNLTVSNAASSPYTLTVMSWAAVIFAPLVIGYQAWTYWVFRQRISADRIPAPIGLSLTE